MAAHALRHGGMVAYPTEAVYGIGCDPLNETAVKRLLRLKQRPVSKGLILIAAEYSQLCRFIIEPTLHQLLTLEQSWPGAITWLIPARPETPVWLRGSHQTIAVRVTAHPVAAALCRQFGGSIVSTSANLSGHSPARNALTVQRYFRNQMEHIVHGKVGPNKNPTEIRSLVDGKLMRSA